MGSSTLNRGLGVHVGTDAPDSTEMTMEATWKPHKKPVALKGSVYVSTYGVNGKRAEVGVVGGPHGQYVRT
jgi:hypothetical protein